MASKLKHLSLLVVILALGGGPSYLKCWGAIIDVPPESENDLVAANDVLPITESNNVLKDDRLMFWGSKKDSPVNPDQYLNAPEIIRRHGYPSESHVILTADGYLLTMHRIPHGKNRPRGGQPVFLQHGLLSSSADWVDSGNRSLAFLLADNGYDVWMGNARGNRYSRAHILLSTDSQEYWDFSFHEMGLKDLPTAFDYVSSVTGQGGKIIYIGHSMGTTMFFVLASTQPEIVQKYVSVMVALAPVAYMTDIRSPIKYLVPYINDVQWLQKIFGLKSLTFNKTIMKIFSYECQLANVSAEICEQLIFLLVGFDKAEFDMNMLPVILSQMPAGASVKTLIHFAQEINNGHFQEYDYGTQGNLDKYGTPYPPKYNISGIRVPIHLMYSENDWLAGPKDVLRLGKNLPNLVGIDKVSMESFNHIDFLWGKDAPKLVYMPLLKFISNFS